MQEPVSFIPWTDDIIEHTLDFREQEFERALEFLGGIGENMIDPPRLLLPRSGLDCLTLDGLRDLPIIDSIIRKQLDEGALFRLLRFPCSLMPQEKTQIAKARVTLRLEEQNRGQAHIYTIYPMKVEIGKEVSTEIALAPGFSIGGIFEVSTGHVLKTFKVQQSQSLITGLWGEDGADWILRPVDDNQGLEGTWDFLALIRWYNSVNPLSISIEVDATVTPLTRRIFIPTRPVHHKYKSWDSRACRDLQ